MSQKVKKQNKKSSETSRAGARNFGTTYTGQKKPSSVEVDKEIESPECNYNIPATKLVELLRAAGLGNGSKDGGFKTFENLFTSLREYEDYSVLRTPQELPDVSSTEEHQTKPPFVEKIVNALFWLPKVKGAKGKKGAYKYLKVRLAPSNIKAAGIGAYAVDPIPKGARGVYKGISLNEEDSNMYYSWTVKSFYPDTGEPDDEDETVYYVDATNLETSNWTRYVNCGMKSKLNNFDSDQLYDKFFYVATRDIEPDEELFIDYGLDYRSDNLGMTGKY